VISRSRAAVVAVIVLFVGGGLGPAVQAQAPARFQTVIEKNVPVTMRDGTIQYADVYRPNAPGRFPVLVHRTPYNKDSPGDVLSFGFSPERGYVVVNLDVRGRYASPGIYHPFMDHGWRTHWDGYDVVQWAAEQPWSNGRVGVFGGSYTGATAYQLAPTQPPNLEAMFTRESSADYFQEWVYRGGAFELWSLAWGLNTIGLNAVERMTASASTKTQISGSIRAMTGANAQKLYDRLPLWPVAEIQGVQGLSEWLDQWIKNWKDGPYWRQFNLGLMHHKVNIPIYHLGGWYDIFLAGTIKNYLGISERSQSSKARVSQKLIIGPWVHGPGNVGVPRQGELVFPNTDAANYAELRLRWFDHWLRGIDNGIMREPPVKIYVMGANYWRDECEWPLARAEYTPHYFNGGKSGSIKSLNDGTLSVAQPRVKEGADTFVYDPRKPVPTLGGNNLNMVNGPRDHRLADEMSLTYTSPVLKEDIEVTGPIKAVLFAASSAVDTDWTVRLSNVYPDGTSINIADGIIRAQFRESMTNPTLITPDKVYRYEVDLWASSNAFRAGHRIRVAVHSSNFPKYNRNLGTGKNYSTTTEMVVANNTIFRNEASASHIILPVIPNGSRPCTVP